MNAHRDWQSGSFTKERADRLRDRLMTEKVDLGFVIRPASRALLSRRVLLEQRERIQSIEGVLP